MSVLRVITKPLRDAYNNREELLEKAKELPLTVLQTALSGVGHALLLGDRVRSTIKRLAGPEEETYESTPAAVDQLASEEPRNGKITPREPVIFAPRPQKQPEKGAEQPEQAEKPKQREPNGDRPEPVIFTPAKKVPAPDVEKATGEAAEKPAKPAVAEMAPEVAAGKPEETVAGGGRPPLPSVTPELVGIAPEPEVVHTEIAPEPVAPVRQEPVTRPATPEEPVIAEERKAAEEPVAVKERVAAQEPPKEPKVLGEPIPGYATLTVPSLRARMRGKTVEQLRELIAYETATAGRDEVVRMYAKRLAKLEAEL
jgi:hypothetical protein